MHIQRWAHNKYSVKLAFFFLSKAVDYLVSSLAEVLVLISFRVFLSFFFFKVFCLFKYCGLL